MKNLLKLSLPVIGIFLLASCSSVRVATDYDREANFDSYKTFAFYKPGIDQAKVSDLDKKRILHAIENALEVKGLTKSEQPDLLVSIFTKTTKNVNIYQNAYAYGYGWRWHPYYWGAGHNTVTETTEGTLYIDLVDAANMQLIWQGMGTGALNLDDVAYKSEQIQKIVTEIIAAYPPEKEKK